MRCCPESPRRDKREPSEISERLRPVGWRRRRSARPGPWPRASSEKVELFRNLGRCRPAPSGRRRHRIPSNRTVSHGGNRGETLKGGCGSVFASSIVTRHVKNRQQGVASRLAKHLVPKGRRHQVKYKGRSQRHVARGGKGSDNVPIEGEAAEGRLAARVMVAAGIDYE
jgi:hypothetical protein